MAELNDLTEELKETTMAVRVKKRQFGRRRALNADQVERAAQVFGADADYLRGSKQLLNVRHEAYRKVTSILSQATQAWTGMTIPYPESGIRLMRKDSLEEFQGKMNSLKGELAAAVSVLCEAYPKLKSEAKARLQELYDEENYPDTLDAAFAILVDYPSVDPPEHLKKLSPATYEAQCAIVKARFEQAVTLTEQAMAAEFQKIVSTLTERLQPQEVVDWVYAGPSPIELAAQRQQALSDRAALMGDKANGEIEEEEFEAKEADLDKAIALIDAKIAASGWADIEQREGKISWRPAAGGKRERKQLGTAETAEKWLTDCECQEAGRRQESKTIKASAVGNLSEFFDKFSKLSIRSNEDLDALVEQAKAAVEGVDVDQIRKEGVGGSVRSALKASIGSIADALDDMVVAAGNRQIDFSAEVD